MTEIIWVVGYPRSGNTWLARLIGDVLNSPVDSRMSNHNPPQPALADEGYDRNGNCVIKQQHLRKLPPDGKIVFIHRDPRDVIVSVKHYWEKTMENAINHVCVGIGKHGGWNIFMSTWLDNLKSAIDCLTAYELLHENTEGELANILKKLDIKLVNPIDEVVNRQSFKSRKSSIDINDATIPYGGSIQNKALYNGKVGEWKNKLSTENKERIHGYLWNWLNRLEYESNENWWQQDES